MKSDFSKRLFRIAPRAIAALAVALAASGCKPKPKAELPLPQASLGSCRFSIPQNATVILYDTYGGGMKSNYRAADRPITYMGRQLVKIPKRGGPVFALLASSGATEWALVFEPGATLAGVLAYGGDTQVITNVPKGTMVGFSNHDGAGEGCPGGAGWDSNGGTVASITPFLNRYGLRINERYRPETRDCEMIACAGKFEQQKFDGPYRSTGGDPAPAPVPAELMRASARLVSAEAVQRNAWR